MTKKGVRRSRKMEKYKGKQTKKGRQKGNVNKGSINNCICYQEHSAC
jgi:hypothetical protein